MKTKASISSKTIAVAAVLLLCAGIGHSADAQQQQIRCGFVNSNVIMAQFEDAQRAQRQFENIVVTWENELRGKIQELQTSYEDFQRRQEMMTDQARIEEQQRLLALEQEINQFRMEKFGQGGAIVDEQERIFRPVREKILNAIEVIARQENLNFVLDRTDEVGVLLYAESRFDVTFKVLDHLKRGNQ
jgi:outer membrane protein